MAKVKATLKNDHYKTSVASATNTIIADEPLEKGGADSGLSPSELLLSALSSCIAITARMYADRKIWPLESVDVTATYSNEQFHVVKHFSGPLTQEQIDRLHEISNRCPIHKILTRNNTILTELA
ncbi:MAG: OsmC family protein [Bacteroidota bacterium]